MNVEIEAKMQVHNAPALHDRLVALNATQGPVMLETNTYFDTPQSSLKSADQGLRVRVERPLDSKKLQTTITHKGPRAHGKLKSRWETEVRVSDDKAAAQLLSALGFQPVFTFEKRRALWDLDGCHIALDHLPYLGDFVEIEGPSDEAVMTMRDKLDLADMPLIQASYISMLSTYLAERRMSRRLITLEDARIESPAT